MGKIFHYLVTSCVLCVILRASLLCSLPCRLRLAQCLQSQEGIDLVRAELAGSPGSAAALAFLATAVKDHGAVGTCIELFRWASCLGSQNFPNHRPVFQLLSISWPAQITDGLSALIVAVSSGDITHSCACLTFSSDMINVLQVVHMHVRNVGVGGRSDEFLFEVCCCWAGWRGRPPQIALRTP